MKRFISKTNQWIVINFTILFIVISAGWSLYMLPQFDFRPYHVGANIKGNGNSGRCQAAEI